MATKIAIKTPFQIQLAYTLRIILFAMVPAVGIISFFLLPSYALGLAAGITSAMLVIAIVFYLLSRKYITQLEASYKARQASVDYV